ncbi:MAG: ScbR family autoregulator-binding transcription factor [Dermabacter sp.]|nr:ScbR family autoregulator-binding transcription factor [Dermabacter sp.]
MQTTLREQQRVRTRTGILKVAAEEFDQRGYAAVALSEIAARLEVTKGTVYFHFPSKAALASAVVDSYFSAWEIVLAEVGRQNLQGIAALRWLSKQVAQSYRDDPGVRAPLRLMREADAIGIDLPTPFLPWVETVARHVHEAQDLGEIRRGLDVEAVAWQIVAGFFGAQEISHQLTGSADIVERVDAMWDLLLPGIEARDSV